jgi:hypothetical protein
MNCVLLYADEKRLEHKDVEGPEMIRHLGEGTFEMIQTHSNFTIFHNPASDTQSYSEIEDDGIIHTVIGNLLICGNLGKEGGICDLEEDDMRLNISTYCIDDAPTVHFFDCLSGGWTMERVLGPNGILKLLSRGFNDSNYSVCGFEQFKYADMTIIGYFGTEVQNATRFLRIA